MVEGGNGNDANIPNLANYIATFQARQIMAGLFKYGQLSDDNKYIDSIERRPPL